MLLSKSGLRRGIQTGIHHRGICNASDCNLCYNVKVCILIRLCHNKSEIIVTIGRNKHFILCHNGLINIPALYIGALFANRQRKTERRNIRKVLRFLDQADKAVCTVGSHLCAFNRHKWCCFTIAMQHTFACVVPILFKELTNFFSVIFLLNNVIFITITTCYTIP